MLKRLTTYALLIAVFLTLSAWLLNGFVGSALVAFGVFLCVGSICALMLNLIFYPPR